MKTRLRQWGPRRPRRARPRLLGKNQKHLSVAMTQEMWAKVVARAYEENVTSAEWIRQAIERKLKDD